MTERQDDQHSVVMDDTIPFGTFFLPVEQGVYGAPRVSTRTASLLSRCFPDVWRKGVRNGWARRPSANR